MKEKTTPTTINTDGHSRADARRSSNRVNARAIFESLRIGVNQDFFTLTTGQVDGLIAEAERVHYRRPVNANGSRARYFHAKLQREANAK
jgi:hypothetical protein